MRDNYRGKGSRCPAKKIEDLRVRHCQLRAGHTGEHVNYHGHRYWGGFSDKLAHLTADLWRTEKALVRREGRHHDTTGAHLPPEEASTGSDP